MSSALRRTQVGRGWKVASMTSSGSLRRSAPARRNVHVARRERLQLRLLNIKSASPILLQLVHRQVQHDREWTRVSVWFSVKLLTHGALDRPLASVALMASRNARYLSTTPHGQLGDVDLVVAHALVDAPHHERLACSRAGRSCPEARSGVIGAIGSPRSRRTFSITVSGSK